MNDDKYRILVVDDEEDLCEILQFNLESEGFEIDIAYSAEEALVKPLDTYHLFLLDVMMDKVSGFQLAGKLRKDFKIVTPIIFLTAKVTENDIITGFNIGADDYITKPFSIKELIVRVKAVLRRTAVVEEKKSKSLVIEGLELNVEEKRLLVDGKRIDLTRKEFDILKLFMKSPGKIFSREEILRKLWSNYVSVTDRTVDVNITRLRKKIGSYGKCIKGRSGYGYSFEIPD